MGARFSVVSFDKNNSENGNTDAKGDNSDLTLWFAQRGDLVEMSRCKWAAMINGWPIAWGKYSPIRRMRSSERRRSMGLPAVEGSHSPLFFVPAQICNL